MPFAGWNSWRDSSDPEVKMGGCRWCRYGMVLWHGIMAWYGRVWHGIIYFMVLLKKMRH